jgi:cell division protein FtsW
MVSALVSLVLVLIPGVGKVVNGSARWLNLGVTSIQVSEFCKLAVVIYLSSYVVRHQHALKRQISGFVRPMLLLSIVGALLILEPDFGATVVILATSLAMLFLAGVPLWQFVALLSVVAGILGMVAISAPYRLQRLTSFLDPWAVQFDSGYQLTQALIAFGRGEWFGVGLGSSIQKLFYLPEAHTDFVFAVLAEELGLVGALATVSLYILFVWRGMIVGLNAEKRDDRFAAFVSYGISLWVGLQTLINIGVNTGILPTKGLTLPFLSYGGSSVLVICIAVGLLVRVDYENHKSDDISGGNRRARDAGAGRGALFARKRN